MNKQLRLLIGALLLTISTTHALVLNKNKKAPTPSQKQRIVKEPATQTDAVASTARPSEQPVAHTRQSMLHTLESILRDPHPDPASQMSREKHQALLSNTLSNIVSDRATRSETDQAVSSIIGDTLNAADVLVHQRHFRMKKTHDTVTNLFTTAQSRLSKTLGEEHHSDTLHRATYFLKAAQAQVQNRCANIVERTRSTIRWITAGGVITTGALAALWFWLRKRASTDTQDEEPEEDPDKKSTGGGSEGLQNHGTEVVTTTTPTPVVPTVEPDKEPELEVVKDIVTAANATGHKISQATAAVPAAVEGVQKKAQDIGNATNDLVKTVVSAFAGKDAGEGVAEALHDVATGVTATVADTGKGVAKKAVNVAATIAKHSEKVYAAMPEGTAKNTANVVKETAKVAAIVAFAANPMATTLAGMAAEQVVEHKKEIQRSIVAGTNSLYIPTKNQIKALWEKASPAEQAALMAGAAFVTYFGISYLVIPATAWGWNSIAVPLASDAYQLICGSSISNTIASHAESVTETIEFAGNTIVKSCAADGTPAAIADSATAFAWCEPYAKAATSLGAAIWSNGTGVAGWIAAPATWLYTKASARCGRNATSTPHAVEEVNSDDDE